MKTVLFAHGFGVMKDARGMFVDIVSSLSELGIKGVLIDLNTKDSEGNILLSPFSKQVEILTKTYLEQKTDETYIIAHSQGCVVSALANLPDIRMTIFLAPPTENIAEKTIAYFQKNPLTTINLTGTSRLARRDGTFTFVPKEYWEEREQLDISNLYKLYTVRHSTIVVKATQDEVVSNEAFPELFRDVETVEIDASHDFAGAARNELIRLCAKLISQV
jgi:hypothetical protein